MPPMSRPGPSLSHAAPTTAKARGALRGSVRFLIAFCVLAFLGALGSSAIGAAESEQRVATILIQGLHRIERDQLLSDLRLGEGDAYHAGLERDLERRGRALPYLRSFRVESRQGPLGMHLTLWLSEARRFRFAPHVLVLDDGDLDGGVLLEGIAPLGLGERWLGTLLVGSYTEASLGIRQLRAWDPRWPALHAEFGVSDYDDPFAVTDHRRLWWQLGPSFRLMGGGVLRLGAGGERRETNPSRGWDPDGKEEHGFFTLAWRQPLAAEPISLNAHLDAELRSPQGRRGQARAVAGLSAQRRQGRWDLEARWAGGLAQHRSTALDLHYMDAWRYLRAYEPGSLPAREFHFGRLRADFDLTGVPIQLRRSGPRESMRAALFVLVESARSREFRRQEFRTDSDWGLGAALTLPTRQPLRASLGLIWNDAGDRQTILLLEQR